MFFTKELIERINAIKRKNGFSFGDVAYELHRAKEEICEAIDAYENGTTEDVGKELADVLIFIFSTADLLEIDLEEATINKVAFNETRVWKKE